MKVFEVLDDNGFAINGTKILGLFQQDKIVSIKNDFCQIFLTHSEFEKMIEIYKKETVTI